MNINATCNHGLLIKRKIRHPVLYRHNNIFCNLVNFELQIYIFCHTFRYGYSFCNYELGNTTLLLLSFAFACCEYCFSTSWSILDPFAHERLIELVDVLLMWWPNGSHSFRRSVTVCFSSFFKIHMRDEKLRFESKMLQNNQDGCRYLIRGPYFFVFCSYPLSLNQFVLLQVMVEPSQVPKKPQSVQSLRICAKEC